MSRGKLRNNIAFHVCRDGADLRIERPLCQCRGQRVIDAGDGDGLWDTEPLLNMRGPGRIGAIGSTGVDDLAADETRSAALGSAPGPRQGRN